MPERMKNAHLAVGAAKQAAGSNFGGQVPKNDSTTVDGRKRPFFIEKHLRYGRENAISTRDLMRMLGMSERAIRHEVSVERRHGAPILSDCRSDGGYYLPGTPEDRALCARSLRHRAAEILAAADAVERYEAGD